MWKYVLKRLVMLIPVLLGVILIIFVLNEITPGDPARELAGDLATEEEVAQLREEMGLNRPFAVRFGDYVWNLVTKGDLGTSYQTKQPVLKEIMQRFPTTLLLTALSTTFMVIVGVSFGVISATRQYSVLDNICSVLGLIGVSMPTFWQGLMMILIFAIKLDILPASGFYGPEYWILPAFTIGTAIGRPDARYHDLRHSYAVAAISSGIDIKTVQGNLGHATAAFTLDVYGHVTDRMKRESADKMEDFIRRVSGD